MVVEGSNTGLIGYFSGIHNENAQVIELDGDVSEKTYIVHLSAIEHFFEVDDDVSTVQRCPTDVIQTGRVKEVKNSSTQATSLKGNDIFCIICIDDKTNEEVSTLSLECTV